MREKERASPPTFSLKQQRQFEREKSKTNTFNRQTDTDTHISEEDDK
jgi:hypothetical protein